MPREQAVARQSSSDPRSAVLLVDDDPGMLETAGLLLRALGVSVSAAETGVAAIHAARQQYFNLALIDHRLPDILGLDVAKAFEAEAIRVPWILMSGGMTVPLAVEAMRHGALDAVARPFDLENVVMPALARVLNEPSTQWSALPLTARLSTPRSATERWAHLVLKGCDADGDLKTLDDWALFVGVSYSRLTEACRMARVRPHDARDFARCLRFLLRSGGRVDRVEDHLDVSDHRTLRVLLERAGVSMEAPSKVMSPREFLERQAFVDRRSQALEIILSLIALPGAGPAKTD